MRKFGFGLLLVSAAVLLFFALKPSAPEGSGQTPNAPRATSAAGAASPTQTGGAQKAEPVELINLTEALNAPGKTIQDDLRILESVFLAWQSNFLKEGNPVGTNAEITAALLGNNSLRLAYVAPNHPAINKQGELCDRWGTPFFFHQVSGSKMEIVSAGPDCQHGTADDARVE
jgi:hypothetical protein